MEMLACIFFLIYLVVEWIKFIGSVKG